MGLKMGLRHLDNGIPPSEEEFHGLASAEMILCAIQATSHNFF